MHNQPSFTIISETDSAVAHKFPGAEVGWIPELQPPVDDATSGCCLTTSIFVTISINTYLIISTDLTSASSLSDIVHQCALEEESESLHSPPIVSTNCDHDDDEETEADMSAMLDNVRNRESTIFRELQIIQSPNIADMSG